VKNAKLLVLSLIFIAGSNVYKAQQDSAKVISAQPEATQTSQPDQSVIIPISTEPVVKRLPAVWIFGIHGVVVDDDGETFKNLFNVSKSWQFLPYPTRISAERSLNKVWRVEAALAYSQYKAGKVVNDVTVMSTQPFVAFDINAKYDLNGLFGETSVFDPYTVSGLGFTHRSALRKDKNAPTLNLGLGFNVWIYKGWGICLQTTAKFSLNPKSSNYMMHSAGIVYRLNFLAAEPGRGSIREPR
jgi:hypothetical protein